MAVLSWSVFSGAVIWLIGFGGGALYSFGALAPDFKAAGNFSQAEVNVIGAASYIVGLALQLPVGIVGVRAPRLVVAVAQSLVALGWGMLALLEMFKPHSTALMAILFSIAGGSVSSISASAFSILVEQAPQYASVTLHGFFVSYALSGGIEAILYTYISPSADKTADELRHKLTWTFGLSSAFNVGVLVVVLFWMFWPGRARQRTQIDSTTTIVLDSSQEPAEASRPTPEDPSVSLLGLQKEPLSLREWLHDVVLPMALYWLMLFLSFGVAVNFYNNAGSIALTLGGSNDEVTNLFLVFCGMQLLGRLLASFLLGPQRPPQHHYLYFTGATTTLCLIAALAYFHNTKVFMYFYSGGNAFVYGSLWVVIFNLQMPNKAIDEAVRVRTPLHAFHLYGVLTLAPAFGPMLFDATSGALYDRQADPHTHVCDGKQCYDTYFLITAVVMFVAVLLAIFTRWLRREARNTAIDAAPAAAVE